MYCGRNEFIIDILGLKVVQTAKKGLGVVARRKFGKNHVFCMYKGNMKLMDCEEHKRAQKNNDVAFFKYQVGYKHNNREWDLNAPDAMTEYRQTFGRMFNCNKEHPNCELRKMPVDNEYGLFIYALRNIEVDEELEWNYRNEEVYKSP